MDLMEIRRALMAQHTRTIGGIPVFMDNVAFPYRNGTMSDLVSDNDFFLAGPFDKGTEAKSSFTYTRHTGRVSGAVTCLRLYNDLSGNSVDYWIISTDPFTTRNVISSGRYIVYPVYKPEASRCYIYDNVRGIYLMKGKDVI